MKFAVRPAAGPPPAAAGRPGPPASQSRNLNCAAPGHRHGDGHAITVLPILPVRRPGRRRESEPRQPACAASAAPSPGRQRPRPPRPTPGSLSDSEHSEAQAGRRRDSRVKFAAAVESLAGCHSESPGRRAARRRTRIMPHGSDWPQVTQVQPLSPAGFRDCESPWHLPHCAGPAGHWHGRSRLCPRSQCRLSGTASAA